MRKLAVLLSLIVLSFGVFAQAQTPTIAEIVVASATGDSPEFTTLLAAVQAADPAVLEALSSEGEYTVFAPTDAAFAAAIAALGDEAFAAILADPAALTDILLFHVVPGIYDSATVVGALEAAPATWEQFGVADDALRLETLQGQSIDIKKTDDGISINGANLVLEMLDIEASNGIIHVIDAVILPESRTIAEIVTELASAEEGAEFTTLLTAVSAAGLVEVVADPEATLTVFAPTDAAFAALAEALGAEAFGAILADPAALANIVTYHVLAERVSSTALVEYATGMREAMEGGAVALADEGVSLTTVNGGELVFTLGTDGLFLNGNIRIIITDVDASNGVIHVIDAVLVPGE
jgi:uncharacterized surface protein with fasciclin (FAS1) repeats